MRHNKVVNNKYNQDKFPDSKGHFGLYGGRYVGETLMPALLELDEAYNKIVPDPSFQFEFARLCGQADPSILCKKTERTP
jgi:tryptophan synthase beta chain